MQRPGGPIQVRALVELHDRGRMTWTGREHGWVARATQRQALVVVEIAGELAPVSHDVPRSSADGSYRDEGGES